jgi:hypothetical protein
LRYVISLPAKLQNTNDLPRKLHEPCPPPPAARRIAEDLQPLLRILSHCLGEVLIGTGAWYIG